MKNGLPGQRFVSGDSWGLPAGILAVLTVFALVFLLLKMLAGNGAEEVRVVIIAEMTEVFGVIAWFMNLYNDSRLYFTVITVLAISIVGISIGLLTDVFMGGSGHVSSGDRMRDHRKGDG